jgi:hypothetical protein
VLSLEGSTETYRSPYAFPYQVLATLDEAVIDTILRKREIRIHRYMGKRSKVNQLAGLFSRDIEVSPRTLRPGPFYIDWGRKASFSLTVPSVIMKEMASRLSAEKDVQVKPQPAERDTAKTQEPRLLDKIIDIFR